MKLDRFDPPGSINDLDGDPQLHKAWSQEMSGFFDTGVVSVQAYLDAHGGGTCQFYNPVTHPSQAPDLPLATGDIPWNGFPKRHGSSGPGDPPDFATAEAPVPPGGNRDQDEYLEWFVNKSGGKIVSVHFTCEAYDYFDFLARRARPKLLELYRTFIRPAVQEADLFRSNGSYNVRNKWNTQFGAMHLTHPANNLFAEVFLAASATVRRRQANGAEITAAVPLTRCAGFGDERRNSDPAIGAGVNGLARQGRRIAHANPVGLYIRSFNGSGLTLNGQPAGGFFRVVRGQLPLGLRAVFELPPQLASQGLTVSDVKLNGSPITFGGQLAQLITMHLVGVATVAQDVHNTPVAVCSPVNQVQPTAMVAAATMPARV